MKDVIRIVLVDPNPQTRDELRRSLSGMPAIWLAEMLNSYEKVVERLKELGAHLTIVTLDHDPVQAVELIERIIQSEPGAVVLPASVCSDSALILKAIRAGAREFLTLPSDGADLLATVTRLLRGQELSHVAQGDEPRIITFTGATGGVGCTSIAVNVAVSLAARKKQETVLIDLDLLFGSVDALLDVSPGHTLADLIQNVQRLDLTLLKRSITRHASGLFILPHPPELEEAGLIDSDAFGRLLRMVKASFNTVLIDASKALQPCDLVAYEMSDVIVVVTQLDLLGVRNTARLLKLFRQTEKLADRVKLIVNRAGSVETEVSVKKAEETLKTPISWEIPNVSRLFQQARVKGVPLAEVAQGSRAHQIFLEVARSLCPDVTEEPTAKRKSRFAALF